MTDQDYRATASIEIRGLAYIADVRGTVSRVYPAVTDGPADRWSPAEGGEVEITSAVMRPDEGDEMTPLLMLQPSQWTAAEVRDYLSDEAYEALAVALYQVAAEEQAGYGRRQREREYD